MSTKLWPASLRKKITNDEKQRVFEAALDIPDERLKDFRDGHKLVRIKRSVTEGKLTEWDVEAVAWCDNVFNIISQVWPILKDINEFHELLTAAEQERGCATNITGDRRRLQEWTQQKIQKEISQ